MKWLTAVDAWLIAKPFQGLIDLTQRGPAWWLEQCSIAIVLSAVAYLPLWDAAVWLSAVMGLVNLLAAAAVFLDSRVPMLMERTAGCHGMRRGGMVLIGILAPIALLGVLVAGDAVGILILMNNGALVSSYYFAACKPPKPREPRRKLVPST